MLNMPKPKNDNSVNKINKTQIRKGKIWIRINCGQKKKEKDNFQQDKPEHGQFWKGTI